MEKGNPMEDKHEHVPCPICRKAELIPFGPTLVCCGCKKMWAAEHEFLTDIKASGLAYYFTPDIHGEIVIYDPKVETHNFIKPFREEETKIE